MHRTLCSPQFEILADSFAVISIFKTQASFHELHLTAKWSDVNPWMSLVY